MRKFLSPQKSAPPPGYEEIPNGEQQKQEKVIEDKNLKQEDIV